MEKNKVLNIVEKTKRKAIVSGIPTIHYLTHYSLTLYSRFHYILILLIAIVVYLIYLIGYYKVQEYRTDAFINSIKQTNDTVKDDNAEKLFLASYIRTKAYATQVAKASQNKKLPGEEVINIVTEDEVHGNAEVDTHDVILQTRERANDPTRNMTNLEKWWWVVTNGIGG